MKTTEKQFAVYIEGREPIFVTEEMPGYMLGTVKIIGVSQTTCLTR